ncbi:hypothetical protein [Pseudonocardia sp. HH130630-07]|uniref:hypothetical protein n=1 Tax=Pseudonocardia sp. HH130630-07 TaxID=1690815 RepID=UPI000839D0D5|nr:hypothetical protein [Pseudonocardia sp. HH130630-07]
MSEAFTEMLATAVTEVLNPALEILSNSLLQTPRPSTIPRLASLWDTSWQIAMAVYATVICVGGLIVMAHQSVQSRLGVREVLPRLMVGFLAGWLTLPLADMAVSIANAVSDELVGPVDEQAGVAGLAGLVRASAEHPARIGGVLPWPMLMALVAIGLLLLAVVAGYIVRVVAIIVLVAAGPLVVMWHALPQTDPLARWWWRALAGLLSIQIVQALVIAVGLAVVLPPTDTPAPDAPTAVLGIPSNTAGWVTLLMVGVLLWVVLRVPGWVWSAVKINAGGKSTVTKLVTAALLYKTGGALRGALAGRAATRSTRPTGTRVPSQAGRGPAASGEVAPIEPTGQWMLPLGKLKRRKSKATVTPWEYPRGVEGAPRPGPGQLAFEFPDTPSRSPLLPQFQAPGEPEPPLPRRQNEAPAAIVFRGPGPQRPDASSWARRATTAPPQVRFGDGRTPTPEPPPRRVPTAPPPVQFRPQARPRPIVPSPPRATGPAPAVRFTPAAPEPTPLPPRARPTAAPAPVQFEAPHPSRAVRPTPPVPQFREPTPPPPAVRSPRPSAPVTPVRFDPPTRSRPAPPTPPAAGPAPVPLFRPPTPPTRTDDTSGEGAR